VRLMDGQGLEDRVTMLPGSLIQPFQEDLSRVKCLHVQGLAKGYGSVYLPFALHRKYPRAGRLSIGQYMFPSNRLSRDPRSRTIGRHHASESGLQRAISQAGHSAGLTKRIRCHTFRHSLQRICATARSGCRLDVLVAAEELARVILLLQSDHA
jgi:integrase